MLQAICSERHVQIVMSEVKPSTCILLILCGVVCIILANLLPCPFLIIATYLAGVLIVSGAILFGYVRPGVEYDKVMDIIDSYEHKDCDNIDMFFIGLSDQSKHMLEYYCKFRKCGMSHYEAKSEVQKMIMELL